MTLARLLLALSLAWPLAGRAAEPAPPARADAVAAAADAAAARAGLQAYLALWSGDAEAGTLAALSPDLVLVYAHALPELRAEIRGRASAVTQTHALARLGRGWSFGDLQLFPTLHAGVHVAQFTASGHAVADGAPIRRHVVVRLELEGGRVVRLVEFANPATGLAAAAG